MANMLAGRPREAFTLLAANLRDDDPWRRSAAMLVRGILRLGTGRVRPAGADLERAVSGFREIGERSGLGQALLMLADIANHDGDPARALALIEEASVLLNPSMSGEDGHLLFARLAGARAQSGDLEGARTELVRARSVLPAGSSVSAESHVLMVEADLARRAGDPDSAIALYESLRADLAGEPHEVGRQQRAMVTCLLARLLAERGDRARVGDLLREALAVLGDSPDVGILLQIIEGFVMVEEDPVRVATIAGSVPAIRGGWAAPGVPSEGIAGVLERARTALGDAGYEAAYAAGRAMDRAALAGYLSRPGT
ncbi:MAG TPA: hypothetical protein VGJ07_08130 [Rugosimonospora sp.]